MDLEPLPAAWQITGSRAPDYEAGLLPGITYEGNRVAQLRLRSALPECAGFGALVQTIAATRYLGRRICFSAMARTVEVTEWAGLWLRVDGPLGMLALDSMQDRPLRGTARGRELLRRLFQDHLDLRAACEQRQTDVAGPDGVPRTRTETGHARPLTTVFGPVTGTRMAYRAPGAPNVHPADAQLNLPEEKHSHGLRRLAAVEAWVAHRAAQILRGSARQVAAGIRRRATTYGYNGTERDGADACTDYLTAKAPCLDYATALAKGWPIATSVIEGAGRHLVADRMAITGARWGLDGAEAILKLRAVLANGDFDQYWPYHLRREHERIHHTLPRNLVLAA